MKVLLFCSLPFQKKHRKKKNFPVLGAIYPRIASIDSGSETSSEIVFKNKPKRPNSILVAAEIHGEPNITPSVGRSTSVSPDKRSSRLSTSGCASPQDVSASSPTKSPRNLTSCSSISADEDEIELLTESSIAGDLNWTGTTQRFRTPSCSPAHNSPLRKSPRCLSPMAKSVTPSKSMPPPKSPGKSASKSPGNVTPCGKSPRNLTPLDKSPSMSGSPPKSSRKRTPSQVVQSAAKSPRNLRPCGKSPSVSASPLKESPVGVTHVRKLLLEPAVVLDMLCVKTFI